MATNGGNELTILADAVTRTLSADATERRNAENWLLEHEKRDGFVSALLNLVKMDSAPDHVRQATAIYMKNFIKHAWPDVSEKDRKEVKSALVNVMLMVPVAVRRQLSAVFALVAEYEYPQEWKELLPELKERLTQVSLTENVPVHWQSLQGILETLLCIFERYKGQYEGKGLAEEVVYSLKTIQTTLLEVLIVVCRVISGGFQLPGLDPNSKEKVTVVLRCADLLCNIFLCLSWHVLSGFFEDHLEHFMSNFKNLLGYDNPLIESTTDNDEPTCVDEVHASVLEILNLYQMRYEEEFLPYLEKFVEDTWTLLVKCGTPARYDRVVTSGMKFLTTVASSVSYKLFSAPDALSQVCRSIVIPNMELREEDEDLFWYNPVEYIRRDMEGSDAETRRRGAIELVKGLCKNFDSKLTEVFSDYMGGASNPDASWKSKDIALCIVTALGWRAGTKTEGAVEVSPFISLPGFFTGMVLPIMKVSVDECPGFEAPILTADSMKFILTFRRHIPKKYFGLLVSHCERMLSAHEDVVKTYAAACMDGLLSVKDEQSPPIGPQGVPVGSPVRVRRLKTEELSPMLPSIVSSILTALKESSRENEYVMRLLPRICSVAQGLMAPFTEQILQVLVEILGKVVKNPSNPLYNHYLFETFSALIRYLGSPTTLPHFEGFLTKPFQQILQDDITEFGPYVFQLLSQMMTIHSGALPSMYSAMIPPLLSPAMWDRRTYIPGMIQYLETYVRKNSRGILEANQLQSILAVFHKLIASKANDHHGINLLCTCVVVYGNDLMQFMNQITLLLMRRLQVGKTRKYTFNLLYCLSVMVIKLGVGTLKNCLDDQEKDLLALLLRQVWIPDILKISKKKERIVCAVATADIACATDLCTAEPYLSLWPQLINTCVAMVENVVVVNTGEDRKDDEEVMLVSVEEGIDGSQTTLRYGVIQSDKGVWEGDERLHLIRRVSTFTARHPGRFSELIASSVEPTAQEALRLYSTRSGLTIG